MKRAILPTLIESGHTLSLGGINVYSSITHTYRAWTKPFVVLRVEKAIGIQGGLGHEDAFIVTAWNREGYSVTWNQHSRLPYLLPAQPTPGLFKRVEV